jgi:nucleoside-diphosphate-sugar epimerase
MTGLFTDKLQVQQPRKGTMAEKKLNCWEFMQCGRGPGDPEAETKGVCPVVREYRLDGVHGGQFSGRACWVVAGTFCGGKAQGTYAKKYKACRACAFYQQVEAEEGGAFKKTLFLLKQLKKPARTVDISTRKFGVLVGGSGLIGGALMHYFKTSTADQVEILAPNSKKLSLREPGDIRDYFQKYSPDFIINCALASLDSDAQLAYEINYLGSINLAKVAMALKIPYIHFSSASVLPIGENLTEDEQLPLSPALHNYAKSKLMAELTLKHLHEAEGLDYTNIRLGVVYGKHDHKIQGFHRMLFTIIDQSMMLMLTKPGVMHSYSNTKKIPPFVHYVLENREEFSGETYHFVDRNPVELRQLILAIKSYLELNRPREIYLPYPLARLGKSCLEFVVHRLNHLGIAGRVPAEVMFLEYFYKTQTLSMEKLKKSSYGDPDFEITVFTELPDLIQYYATRWQHFNLLSSAAKKLFDLNQEVEGFVHGPQELIDAIHSGRINHLGELGNMPE